MKKELIYDEDGYINEVEISRSTHDELGYPIWIKKGDIELECSNRCARPFGVVQGEIYQAAIFVHASKSIEILDKSTIGWEEKPKSKAEKFDESYAYDLYGIVIDGIFHLGEFQFLFMYGFEEYFMYIEDYIYTKEPYIKWRVGEIVPDFLKRIDVGIQKPVFSWKKL